MKKAIWFIFFLLLAVSCLDEPDCFQLNNNTVTVAFKILGSGTTDQVPLIVGKTEKGTDSILVTSAITVPLSVLEKEMGFLIKSFYNTDTLDLAYNRQVQYVSEDCGERYVYSDLWVLDHSFDSVLLVNTTPAPETSAYNNIVVYRCPRTNFVGIDIRQINSNGVEVQGSIKLKSVKSITTDFGAPIFLANATPASVYVPLNDKSDETTITFDRIDGPAKTLTLSYKRTVGTRFERCGPNTLFSELRVKSKDFTEATLIQGNDGVILDSTQDPPILNLKIIQ